MKARPDLNVLSPSPDNIWSYRQNRPSLVARDLEAIAGVPRDTTFRVLLARGVFKWLAVRRDLVRLKHAWRQEISNLYVQQREAKAAGDAERARRIRARREALELCRAQVRALCHSERWRAPDFDGEAWAWLLRLAPCNGDGVPDSVRRVIRRGRDVKSA